LLDEPFCETADTHATVDRNHGRVETRTAFVSTEVTGLKERHRWPGLAAAGKVTRIRGTLASVMTEPGYYLTSAALSPERLRQVVRSHWGIENRLHWVLNVVMNEDQTRNRYGNSAYNLAILRHMALNLIQRDHSQVSLRSKFNLAAWKDEFLAKLLAAT
jgi:predicted transposase YbfD/YdcC